MSLPEPSLKDSSLNTEFLNDQGMFRLFWRKWSADCAVLVKNRSIFLVDPKDKAYAMFGGFRE